MKYGRLVVFIRHDSAEVWGFRYGLTPGIGTLTAMARTGVFVRIVFALERHLSGFSRTPSTILTFKQKNRRSHSHRKMGPERDFYEGRQRKNETERQPRMVVSSINLST
jgi:hypothetical protein